MPHQLSRHQRKVLAALLELETAHGSRWWFAHTIGKVVGVGGWHASFRDETWNALKAAGCVEDGPDKYMDLGLTPIGRIVASEQKVCWTPESRQAVTDAVWELEARCKTYPRIPMGTFEPVTHRSA